MNHLFFFEIIIFFFSVLSKTQTWVQWKEELLKVWHLFVACFCSTQHFNCFICSFWIMDSNILSSNDDNVFAGLNSLEALYDDLLLFLLFMFFFRILTNNKFNKAFDWGEPTSLSKLKTLFVQFFLVFCVICCSIFKTRLYDLDFTFKNVFWWSRKPP